MPNIFDQFAQGSQSPNLGAISVSINALVVPMRSYQKMHRPIYHEKMLHMVLDQTGFLKHLCRLIFQIYDLHTFVQIDNFLDFIIWKEVHKLL